MKLLLDENLSDKTVQQIADLYPGSRHIKAVGLKEADDSSVWAWAKQHGFTIASKDTDFYQRRSCSDIHPRSSGCGSAIVQPA